MGRIVLFDWPLFIIGILLSVSGLVYVYSATWVAQDPPGPYFSWMATKQIIFFALSLVVFTGLRRINWGLKPDSWLWFYLPVVILLVLVLIVGSDHGTGADRWIGIGGIDIQPSEFAKLSFVMILAWLYSSERPRLTRHFFSALWIMASMLILMLMQPDLGTSLVFVFIFFVMSAFTPIPRRLLVFTALGFLLLCIPAWFALRDYQKNRLLAFVGWELERNEQGQAKLVKAEELGTIWQVRQSAIAIGSGGLWGKGFLKGTQSRGGFIPEIENDFIFALVAEEYGFFGCFFLLLLYFLLLARILAIAREAKTPYEMYICFGTSALIFFHVLVGTGMTLGLTPITGLPLPFVSQGGSSLMTMWLLLAVNQAVYSNSRQEFQGSRLRR